MSARVHSTTAGAATALFALLLAVPAPHSQGRTLKVATYNLWNVMFNWDVRKHHIATMIREADVDVVAFQEVRADQDEKRTQLLEMKELLPSYRWHVYLPVQKVVPYKGAPAGWEMEGLGLLSRHPITGSSAQSLTHQSPKDKNQRMVLHASVHLNSGLNVSLAVSHLSYDHWQQCVNVAEIMKHVRVTRPVNSIIMGDFNTYIDYPWPLEGLLYGYFSTGNKCPKYAAQKNPTVQADLVSYLDAWAEVNPNKNGFTFSNMPQPGFQSRPDRVLFSSKSWKVHSCEVVGLGEAYAKRYSLKITRNRALTVRLAAESAFYLSPGPRGCSHDCGPHGSCRCGICVAGGDKNRCEIPDCPECSASVYQNFLIARALFCLLALQFVISVVSFVQQLKTRRSRILPAGCSMACRCLTIGNRHRTSSTPKAPRSGLRAVFLLRIIWPLLYLQPVYQLLICGICGVLLVVLCFHVFEESLRIIFAILPEELNPSDHLMVVATADLFMKV